MPRCTKFVGALPGWSRSVNPARHPPPATHRVRWPPRSLAVQLFTCAWCACHPRTVCRPSPRQSGAAGAGDGTSASFTAVYVEFDTAAMPNLAAYGTRCRRWC